MGAFPAATRSSMVSWSGVSRYSNSSGTGRSALRTSATSRPVSSRMPSVMRETSPSVADRHPDVLRAKEPAEREEFLVHERLDRARVHGAAALGHRLEVEERRHE